ncbi:MAG: Na+/H+ antiporter subunit E [Candidatus Bipolaricaulia bacterium]
MIPAVLVLSLLWIALSRSLDLHRVLIGVAVSFGVVLFQRVLFPRVDPFVSALLRRPHRLVAFGFTLLYRLIVSTLFTSWLILSGKGEGRLMALPVRVSHPLGQFVLLNSITLTPSTISLLVEGDVVYLHWLQARDGKGDWRTVKESIERRVLALFPQGEHGDR